MFSCVASAFDLVWLVFALCHDNSVMTIEKMHKGRRWWETNGGKEGHEKCMKENHEQSHIACKNMGSGSSSGSGSGWVRARVRVIGIQRGCIRSKMVGHNEKTKRQDKTKTRLRQSAKLQG